MEKSTRFTSFHTAELVKTGGKIFQPVKEIKLNATTGFKVGNVSDRLDNGLKYIYNSRILRLGMGGDKAETLLPYACVNVLVYGRMTEAKMKSRAQFRQSVDRQVDSGTSSWLSSSQLP